MKTALKILFILSFGLIILGYVLLNFTQLNGTLFIGIGVFSFAFVLIPLFIYVRYKGRVGDFIDRRMEQPDEEN